MCIRFGRPLGPSPAGPLAAALLLVLAVRPAGAQAPPSPADVLGWDMGERFTDVAQVNRYMQALAEASDRVSVIPYGETVEGRPLIQVLVASTEHRGRLEEILERNRELVDPETSAERAAEIVRENPAVVYFSYGVHGNESSSSEAAMWTAWDLARDADEVRGVLDSLVVVLDPVVNPDGRERYVSFYRSARGPEPDPDPEAREHREPWPGGRYNHWLFDLNRDWAWLSQPETRARLDTWDRWNPQVHVDFHEMSWQSTYFFFPAAPPINPIYPPHILDWGRRFGEGNARAFDARGWLYFTGESYDLFYPGYGDSWPALLGTVGMTYEQAGGGFAGLAVERPDGSVLTLRDRAEHHRTTGQATLRTAAEGRTDLLSGFAGFHRSVDEGLSDVLLVPGTDPSRVRALVDLLRAQGIRVERAGEAFEADAAPHRGFPERERFPAGTYRVPARQPRGRLAITLLRPETFLDASFSYDITAWSLPYAFGVEAHSRLGGGEAAWSGVEAPAGPEPSAGPATYGYLLPPGYGSAPGLVRFLEEGGRALALTDTFTLGERSWPRGSLFLPRGRNEELDSLVRRAGLSGIATPVATGWTATGPDLGTGESAPLELPEVALLGGEGTSPTSYGAHWFFLDQRLGLPFDAVNVEDVADLDLASYDVIVVPSGGGVEEELGEDGLEALAAWVRAGGTLVAVAGSAEALAAPLAEVERRTELSRDDEMEREERLALALRTREDRERERWQESIPGTILQVSLDPRHPLGWGSAAEGTPGRTFVLTGGTVFEPDEAFESVAFFPQGLEKVSGVISERNLERMERGTWLLQKEIGEGSVILFADDPLFRMFWYGGFPLYTNALLMVPAF